MKTRTLNEWSLNHQHDAKADRKESWCVDQTSQDEQETGTSFQIAETVRARSLRKQNFVNFPSIFGQFWFSVLFWGVLTVLFFRAVTG